MTAAVQEPFVVGAIAQIKEDASILSEAYRLRLIGRLWWANLTLVALPAAMATCATGFAGFAGGSQQGALKSPAAIIAAVLAGSAAVLTAIHKALKCEEYQSECLRLSREYKRVSILADSLLASRGQSAPPLPSPQELAQKFADIAASANAPLPDLYLRRATERHRGAPGDPQSPPR